MNQQVPLPFEREDWTSCRPFYELHDPAIHFHPAPSLLVGLLCFVYTTLRDRSPRPVPALAGGEPRVALRRDRRSAPDRWAAPLLAGLLAARYPENSVERPTFRAFWAAHVDEHDSFVVQREWRTP